MEEGSVPSTRAGKGMVCWVSLEKCCEMGSSGRGDWRQRPKPDHSDPVATQASPAFIFWSKVSHNWNRPCNWSGGSQKWVPDQKHQHPLGTREKFKAPGSTVYLPNQKLWILRSPPGDTDTYESLSSKVQGRTYKDEKEKSEVKDREIHTETVAKAQNRNSINLRQYYM